MKQITKYIGLFAILPLALIALTPDLIGDADAYQQSDAKVEVIKTIPLNDNGSYHILSKFVQTRIID